MQEIDSSHEIASEQKIPQRSLFAKFPWMRWVLIGLVIFLLLGGGFVVGKNRMVQKACTLEAKICPDGSSVGRTGPTCEFALCPTDRCTLLECAHGCKNGRCLDKPEAANWKMYTNDKLGIQFQYPRIIQNKYEVALEKRENGNDGLVFHPNPRGSWTELLLEIEANKNKFQPYTILHSCDGKRYFWPGTTLAKKPCIKKDSIADVRLGNVQAKKFYIQATDTFGFNYIQTVEAPYIELIGKQDFFDQILSTFKFLDQSYNAISSSKGSKIFENENIKFAYPQEKFDFNYKTADSSDTVHNQLITISHKTLPYSLVMKLNMYGIGGGCPNFPKGYELSSINLDGKSVFKAQFIDEKNAYQSWPVGKIYLVMKNEFGYSCPNVAGLSAGKGIERPAWIEYELSKLSLNSAAYKDAEKELDQIVLSITKFWK